MRSSVSLDVGVVARAFLLVPMALAWISPEGKSHGGGLGRRLAFLFVFIAGILLTEAGLIHRYLSTIDGADAFFDLSREEESLSERMLVVVEARMAGDDRASGPLMESVRDFEQAQRFLEEGSPEADQERRANRPPAKIAVAIAAQRSTWERARPLLAVVVRLPEGESAPPGLVVSAREAVSALEEGAEALSSSLHSWRQGLRARLLYSVWGASFLGLGALGLWLKLLWDGVVTPVRRLRDEALFARETDGEVMPDNELEAVAFAVRALSSDVDRLRRERAQMRRDLRRAEADYQAVFDNAVAGILRFDAEGRILIANRALASMLGFSSVDELLNEIGDVHGDLFADPQHRARFDELHRARGRVELETKARRKDGSTLWILESASVEEGADGTRTCEAVLVDITAMKKAQESLRELSGLLLNAQDGERRRIARELHDSTGQLLAVLEMNLGRLDELVPAFRESLTRSMDLAAECNRQIRSLSYLLHPPMLEELGLVYALRDYTRGLARRSEIAIELQAPAELSRLEPDAELALFRVVQEALANVQRHSGSPDAVVRVLPANGWIRVEVEDHGRGIPGRLLASNGEGSLIHLGVGMRGMEERMRQLGGRLSVESETGRTLVAAEVPRGEATENGTPPPTIRPGSEIVIATPPRDANQKRRVS